MNGLSILNETYHKYSLARSPWLCPGCCRS